MIPTLEDLIAQLETVYAAMCTATAPIDAQIAQVKRSLKALDLQKAVLAEPFMYELESLQYAIRTLVMEEQLPQVTTACFTVFRKEHVQWDDAGLQGYAVEQPSVLQFRQVVPSTVWRWHPSQALNGRGREN